MKMKKLLPLLPLVVIFFTAISVSRPASAYSKSDFELPMPNQNLIIKIVLDRLDQKEVVIISNVLPFDGVLGLFNAIF